MLELVSGMVNLVFITGKHYWVPEESRRSSFELYVYVNRKPHEFFGQLVVLFCGFLREARKANGSDSFNRQKLVPQIQVVLHVSWSSTARLELIQGCHLGPGKWTCHSEVLGYFPFEPNTLSWNTSQIPSRYLAFVLFAVLLHFHVFGLVFL